MPYPDSLRAALETAILEADVPKGTDLEGYTVAVENESLGEDTWVLGTET